MNDLDLNAVHNVELNILKAVDALCEKHGIRYSIYCGTLLGAVRHGGFIPWDNDVDITMPLGDYRRFLQVADELPEQYVCTHYGNTRDCFYPWARVMDRNTTFMDRKIMAIDAPFGIFADIYPMLGAAPTSSGIQWQRRLLLVARRLRNVPLYRVKGDGGIVKRLLYLIPFRMLRSASNFLLNIVMRDPNKSKRIGSLDAAPFDGKFLREDWEEMIRLPFEDGEFSAPANFDKFLRIMYGDYTKLPPVEMQNSDYKYSEDTIFDPHRGYEEYRRELLGQ